MTPNERIAKAKGWTGPYEADSLCGGRLCNGIGCEHWHRPDGMYMLPGDIPNYTGSLEASDGLLEEIRAKGFAVCFWMHPGGMDELSIWDTEPGICRYQYATGTLSEMSAEAWLAVFGG